MALEEASVKLQEINDELDRFFEDWKQELNDQGVQVNAALVETAAETEDEGMDELAEDVEVLPWATGEEEDVLLKLKVKLFRFAEQEWKERGTGVVKLLRHLHGQSHKVRLVMRQSRTKKVCANHYLFSGTELRKHRCNDKSWLWHAICIDFSDGELKKELLLYKPGRCPQL